LLLFQLETSDKGFKKGKIMKKGKTKSPNNPSRKKHNKILSTAQTAAEWDSLYHSTTENMTRGAQEISKITPHARHDNWRTPAKGKNNRHAVKKRK
jgi:hypothetical protein